MCVKELLTRSLPERKLDCLCLLKLVETVRRLSDAGKFGLACNAACRCAVCAQFQNQPFRKDSAQLQSIRPAEPQPETSAYFLWFVEMFILSLYLKWPTDLPLLWNCVTSHIMPANAYCLAFRQQSVAKPEAEWRKDIGCRVVAFASRAHRHHQEGSKWNWTPWKVLGGTEDENE